MPQVAKQERLNALVQQLAPKLKVPEDVFLEFSQRLFNFVGETEFASIDDSMLLGMLPAIWAQFEQSAQAELLLFNPDVESSHWHSRHSVLILHMPSLPFVIDSVRMFFAAQSINTRLLFHAELGVQRHASGRLAGFAEPASELIIFAELDQQTEATLQQLTEGLQEVLARVETVVTDHQPMRELCTELMSQCTDATEPEQAFMSWLLRDHLTFLAVFPYRKTDTGWVIDGHLAKGDCQLSRAEHDYYGELLAQKCEHGVFFAKDMTRGQVHRPSWPDLIFVSGQGQHQQGLLIRGLYTSAVYHSQVSQIPLLQDKIAAVMQASGLARHTHYYNELRQTLVSLPLDEVLLSTEQRLLQVGLAMVEVQERRLIRVFVRQDPASVFAGLMILVPRDLYDTKLRKQFLQMLAEYLPYQDYDFETKFSESVLARAFFTLRLAQTQVVKIDLSVLEYRLRLLAKRWQEGLQEALIDSQGERAGMALFQAYQNALPTAYTEAFPAVVAVQDILRLEQLNDANALSLSFYREPQASSEHPGLKLKLFYRQALTLSDLIPVLENLGLRVVDEFPYPVRAQQRDSAWIYDLSLIHDGETELDLQAISQHFAEAFNAVWQGKADNDAFNRLLIPCHLNWRQIAMLRAYAKYMKQIRMGVSEQYIADVLFNYPDICLLLTRLFASRFDPNQATGDAELLTQIEQSYEQVAVLTDDRLLRKYQALILATVRTNYYCQSGSRPVDVLSFKLRPALVGEVPKPHPMYEIFVYSPRVEGVHFRFGRVARGGLRWSDRFEDYRTEVLGLVKAQQVKNSVIVPVGAKGGFVAKCLPTNGDRQAWLNEGQACYRLFIASLLDLTDNLNEQGLQPPKSVLCHDEPDPYLVVAADKGTATFSDLANEVAHHYGFWLGDAFASGGSQGYDHKKMGITARGAWISVQHHFKTMGIDIQQQSIRVVGIGDMAGDVFGNGLLLSKQVQLVAAFNHQHIFIDPNPDPETSFAERQRLFDLPRSSWSDYQASLLSAGGAIFSRAAKAIHLSAEAAQALGLSGACQLTPNELITAILKAPVDLLWNGGIGTYIKARAETNAQVGDKANDGLRVSATQVRAKVLGEGGNLGVTQLGRIEFAQHGGLCFTDFIDNAGGVDCSDHEVNAKILLDECVRTGDLTQKQRNEILVSMTEDVAQLVLRSNYLQANALGLACLEAPNRLQEHRRQIQGLEKSGRLNRHLEAIPSEEQLNERKALHQGLVSPELAIMMALTKSELKERLIEDRVGEDKSLLEQAFNAFPEHLVQHYAHRIGEHRLLNELVATQIANDMVNHMGISYPARISLSTGCQPLELAKAYLLCKKIFNLSSFWLDLERLDFKVDYSVQSAMALRLMRLIRHASRWLIRNHRADLNMNSLLDRYAEPMQALQTFLEGQYLGEDQGWFSDYQSWKVAGVPSSLARTVAASDYFYSGLSIIDVATHCQQGIEPVAQVYYQLGHDLGLDRFQSMINRLPVASHWQVLARESLRDDLELQQRRLAQSVMSSWEPDQDLSQCLVTWSEKQPLLRQRWLAMIEEIGNTSDPEFSMYSVAMRELVDLSQAYAGT